ncbi:MAG: DUF499 domain-containing protein [Pyrobaculum sp.]
MSYVKLLAEGKISPAIDIYEVYKSLFRGESPEGAHRAYCDPDSFFRITYVTPSFRQYLEDFLRKLAAGESQIYTLPALLGAGKSHFLALVLHVLALYGKCKGAGECVRRHLADYGVDISAPTLAKTPAVAVFRAGRVLGEFEKRLRSISTKEELRRVLREKAPVVILFDETQYLEEEPGFVQWIQMLAEVAGEVGGVYLFVSYSLFPEGGPSLESSRSLSAVERMNAIRIRLDTVRNIAAVFRRWAGLKPGRVDTAPLKGVVRDELLREFEGKVAETYPFNPVFLKLVLDLADESLAERTRVQLTRELLRTLARAYVKASEGELVTFAHLPEPEELLLIGGPHADFWAALLKLYEEDVEKLGTKAAVSVLRHILLASFIGRLMPSAVLYPTEDELILGSYNALDIRPVDVKEALARASDVGLHVEKLGDRYIYWYIGDEAHALREAMSKFSYEDGIDVVADQLASLLRERAGPFSAVYISGVGDRKRAFGKVVVLTNREEWSKALEDADKSALAVDLSEFGIVKRRNNLFYVRRDDAGAVPRDVEEVLRKFVQVRNIREAAVALGQLYKAAEEVLLNLNHYFPELFSFEEDRLRREMEQMLRGRVERWKERAAALLKTVSYMWLKRVIAGFNELEVKRLDEYLGELARQKMELVGKVVEKVFSQVEWDGFKKLGDLWSLYLNNEGLPHVPMSFDEFIDAVRSYCAGCSCLFEVDGEVVWLSKTGCEIPHLDKNVGVAPLRWRGQLQDWAVEAFLKQMASLSTHATRYYIVYKRPSGEEVKKPVDDLLASRGEWPFLSDGHLEVETLQKAIEVRIDGVAAPSIERNPGSKIRVDVVGSDDLISVAYRIGGIEREEDASGKVHFFELELPTEPGTYSLEVEAVFKDGARDRKTVVVNIKGRCKKLKSKYEVGAGERVRYISATTVKDARDLLQFFSRRGAAFKLYVSAMQTAGDAELDVKARFNISSQEARDRAARLLAALETLSPSADVKFEFTPPVEVDGDLAQRLRGGRYTFEVEVEEIC